jgi:hypothetical protein
MIYLKQLLEQRQKKLQDSNRGIWKGKLLESLNIEVVENGDDITLNIYAESYMEFIDQGINGAGFNQTKVIDLIGGSNQIEVLLQVLLIRIKIRNHH